MYIMNVKIRNLSIQSNVKIKADNILYYKSYCIQMIACNIINITQAIYHKSHHFMVSAI